MSLHNAEFWAGHYAGQQYGVTRVDTFGLRRMHRGASLASIVGDHDDHEGEWAVVTDQSETVESILAVTFSEEAPGTMVHISGFLTHHGDFNLSDTSEWSDRWMVHADVQLGVLVAWLHEERAAAVSMVVDRTSPPDWYIARVLLDRGYSPRQLAMWDGDFKRNLTPEELVAWMANQPLPSVPPDA